MTQTHKLCTLLLAFFFLFTGAPCAALGRSIGPQDSALLADPSGKIVFSKNRGKMLVPASTLKVLTALSALHYLGEGFRFTTDFYLDHENNLKIQGQGDPLLISEVICEIAGKVSKVLNRKGIEPRRIVLDNSFFKQPVLIPGVAAHSTQPYDAPNGALCANFNTIDFRKSKCGKPVSAEPQTPMLPFVSNRIKASGLDSGRITLTQEESALYAGHLFKYFMTQNGITSLGEIRRGKVHGGDTLIYSHRSRYSLAEVIEKLLYHSNNYTANQIFMRTGTKVYGRPASLEKGVRATLKYLNEQVQTKGITLVEGSGISRRNRVSAETMLQILKKFKPYHVLMRKKGNDFYKTGTLSDIRTRCGYLKDKKGRLYMYAIMINSPGKSTDSILKDFKRYVQNAG